MEHNLLKQDLLTIVEAAALAGVSHQAVTLWIQRGLPGVHRVGTWLIERDAFMVFLTQRSEDRARRHLGSLKRHQAASAKNAHDGAAPSAIAMPGHITIADAARRAGVDSGTVEGWLRRVWVEGVRIGTRRWLLVEGSVDALLQGREQKRAEMRKPGYVTAAEAAKRGNTYRSLVLEWLGRGVVTGVHLEGGWLVEETSLQEWLQRREQRYRRRPDYIAGSPSKQH